MKNIDNDKYRKYTALASGQEMLNALDDPSYSDRMSFTKASQAIEFLKSHTQDNEFEREASTTAIIMAIEYLSEFETELKKAMIEGIAKENKRAEIAKKARIEAEGLLEKKINPAAEKLIAEFEKLGTIEGYSHYWLSNDFEALIKQISDAAGLIARPSVMISPR